MYVVWIAESEDSNKGCGQNRRIRNELILRGGREFKENFKTDSGVGRRKQKKF